MSALVKRVDLPAEVLQDAPRIWQELGSGMRHRVIDPEWRKRAEREWTERVKDERQRQEAERDEEMRRWCDLQAVAEMRAVESRYSVALERYKDNFQAIEDELASGQERMHRLFAECDELQKEVARLTEKRDRLTAEMPTLAAKSIIRRVSKERGISVSAITGQQRSQKIIHARHEAMYEVRRLRPDLSSPQLGRLFGDRDHTTVLSAIKRWPSKAASLGISCESLEASG